MIHIQRPDWLYTPNGQPRGYIQPGLLRELWFHTGTICNLKCPFCLEGSGPGDNRLNTITFEETKPYIDEAMELGVEQFSFTGGEPFVNRDIIRILDYALDRRPCLVLTNGTTPLRRRLGQLLPLLHKPNPIRLRISLDFPDPDKHDAGRGKGNFWMALDTAGKLHKMGFFISIARQRIPGEDSQAVDKAYLPFFHHVGLPEHTPIVSFPDFLPPGSKATVPYITENCMTRYKDEKNRSEFMCYYSKMVVKKDGQMRVYACTLVDDDPDYDLGTSLSESMKIRIMLKHHRCYACFSCGACCSELSSAIKKAGSRQKPNVFPIKILQPSYSKRRRMNQ